MEICEVCTIQNHKYKCPRCKLKYCSAPCYKLHTENACVKPEEPPAEEKKEDYVIDKIGTTTDIPMLDDEPDLVPEDKLEKLGNSQAVLDSLQNPHLRRMIASIAEGENGQDAIHSAMMEPLFVEFVNKCLTVVEPDTELMEEDESDDDHTVAATADG